MLQETLTQLFTKDLNKLKDEIAAYSNEADLWKIEDGIANSAGNLCLHLVGNLKHFIGKTLGNISYERNREKEFTDKDVPSAILIKSIDETINAVAVSLQNLSAEELAKIYPINVFGSEMTTENFLIHLYGHLNYHLGQINYHRRLLNK